jgi:predicted nucleic acid-binding protein
VSGIRSESCHVAAGVEATQKTTRSETREIVGQISGVIERRPSYKQIVPDPEIWREAGVLSGILARLQGYGKDHRRRALNDALRLATARKYGCTILSRNVGDFDLLEQLDPAGGVLFYK